VELPALPADKEIAASPLVNISLSYFNVLSTKLEQSSVTSSVDRPLALTVKPAVDFNLDKQYNRLLAAEAMEQANRSGQAGDLTLARSTLTSVMQRIQNSVSASDPFCVGLLTDLKQCQASLKDHNTYEQQGAQMLMNNVDAHYKQRSNNVNMASQQAYQTSSRNMQQEQQQKVFTKKGFF